MAGNKVSTKSLAGISSCKAKILFGLGGVMFLVYHFHLIQKTSCALHSLLVVESELTHPKMGLSSSKVKLASKDQVLSVSKIPAES